MMPELPTPAEIRESSSASDVRSRLDTVVNWVVGKFVRAGSSSGSTPGCTPGSTPESTAGSNAVESRAKPNRDTSDDDECVESSVESHDTVTSSLENRPRIADDPSGNSKDGELKITVDASRALTRFCGSTQMRVAATDVGRTPLAPTKRTVFANATKTGESGDGGERPRAKAESSLLEKYQHMMKAFEPKQGRMKISPKSSSAPKGALHPRPQRTATRSDQRSDRSSPSRSSPIEAENLKKISDYAASGDMKLDRFGGKDPFIGVGVPASSGMDGPATAVSVGHGKLYSFTGENFTDYKSKT